MNYTKLKALLQSPTWRLNNLYTIVDVKGQTIPFKLNSPQRTLMKNWHPRMLIPKARQHGISTLMCIIILDQLIHFKGVASMPIIDKTIEDAKKKLLMIKLAWDNIDNEELFPDTHEYGKILKKTWTAKFTKTEATFIRDGQTKPSTLFASTSARGGTSQFVFSSELGYTDSTEPEKSKGILSGAYATAHGDTPIVMESTLHCGRSGVMYDLIAKAKEKQDRGDVIAPNEFKFIFLGWQENDTYVDYHPDYKIPVYIQEYFRKLEENTDVKLTLPQKVWYAKHREAYPSWDDMYQEYPTTLDEVLSVGGSGTIYGPQIETLLRDERVQQLTPTPHIPIHAFWDLGFNDGTCCILAQVLEGRIIKILKTWEERKVGPAPIYAEVSKYEACINRKVSTHYLPHDGGAAKGLQGETYEDMFIQMGANVQCIPRAKKVWKGIDYMRRHFKQVWLDSSCTEKISRDDDLYSFLDSLQGYHKKTNGEPAHDKFSHSCDAFRMIGEAQLHGLIYEYEDQGEDSNDPYTYNDFLSY